MLRFISILLICTLFAGFAQGQSITLKGKLSDKADKSSLSAATIKLTLQKDSNNTRMVITDKSGNFAFNNLEAGAYTLFITHSGYEKIQQKINIQASNNTAIPFSLSKLPTDLTGVTIVSKAAPVRMKVDTTEFSASQFKVNPDATAEDLIKKLPGIVIDKSGNVTTMGEQVKKVTVDGRDFFGDDATAALKNLPADVIDKIQVFDKLSDQAAFTGFDDGNSTKAINIVTKAGMRNGQFGRVYAGYGTDNRYAAGGNMSFFKKDRRISLVGLFNNVNQQNFSSEDLLGVTSSGGGNRGGGNRGGGGRGGGGNNFMVGQQTGISSTNAFGINYSDKWGKKLDVSGSYFFNNSNTGNDQSSNTQSLVNNQFNDQSVISTSKNYNNRFNLRMEYKIDEKNSLMFTPSFSFQKNNSFNELDGASYFIKTSPISTQRSTTSASTSGYNSNNNLLFRHSFAKKGRTISLNLSAGLNHKSGNTYLNSVNDYYDTSGVRVIATDQLKDQLVNGNTFSASVVYTEPIGKKGQLQLNYNPSVSKNKSDLETFNYDHSNNKYSLFDTGYSNKFNSTQASQSVGVSYRVGDRDNMFSVGGTYKYLKLTSDQLFPMVVSVNKPFNNFLPNLMWRKKISAKSTINIMYRASTNPPSISQLQNVIDNSNTLMVTSGNPDLKQQVSNTLSTRYTFSNTKTSKSFFANLFLQQASNYVANATYIAKSDSALSPAITLHRGSQLTKPVNLDGFVSVRSLLTYAMPVKFIKSNLNLNAGVTYSKIPGLNNKVSTTSNNYTFNGGLGISSNISQYIDFNVSYNASVTNTKNSADASNNTNYTTQSAALQLNLLSKKGWFVQNDLSYTGYSGLGAGYNQQFVLWNAGIGKKFLKNQAGELKLSVFDLLKQNQSITRTVDPSFIEDVRNQVLQQYFLLTFTYKLKNFGTAKVNTNNNNHFEGPRPGGAFPPGF
ncbi:MAG: DUF2012 domain-containing protein [Sphingobacteriales bacterium]|nr:DUF2012 domain-containing protein [Sphingobacteriales bacterium]